MPDNRITLTEQLTAAKRALRLRRDHYPAWVQRGSMTQDWAEYQLACQQAIVLTLQQLLDKEQLTLSNDDLKHE